MRDRYILEETVPVRGYPITFKKCGQGFPLILTHTSHFYAKYFFASLPKNTPYQLYTLDIPGYYHYGHQKKPILSIDLFVDLMAELLEKLEIERADFIGECLGSYLVLKFAAKYPEKVRRSILLAPPLRVFHPKVKKSIYPLISFLAKNRIAGKIAKFILSHPNPFVAVANYAGGYSELKDFLKLDRYIFFKRDFDPRIFFGIIADLFRTDPEEIYRKVNSEILIISGTKDLSNSTGGIKEISRKIKNSKYILIPNADHALIEKRTKEANEIIQKFLLKPN